jgi:hypothetical protein
VHDDLINVPKSAHTEDNTEPSNITRPVDLTKPVYFGEIWEKSFSPHHKEVQAGANENNEGGVSCPIVL